MCNCCRGSNRHYGSVMTLNPPKNFMRWIVCSLQKEKLRLREIKGPLSLFRLLPWLMPKTRKASLSPNKAVCLPALTSKLGPIQLLGWTRRLIRGLALPWIRVLREWVVTLGASVYLRQFQGSRAHQLSKYQKRVTLKPPWAPCSGGSWRASTSICAWRNWLMSGKLASPDDRRMWVMAPPLNIHPGETQPLQPDGCLDSEVDGEWAEIKTGNSDLCLLFFS